MDRYVPVRQANTGPLRVLGLPTAPSEQIAAAEEGLEVGTFRALAEALGVSEARLASITRMSQTTLTRRKRGGRFTVEESEHLLRIALLLERAATVFGSADDAAGWLKEPNLSLGNVAPLEFARSEIGAREVSDLLGRIEHGVYS
jgi:putative toxin-antitoxin system antitoxin component (TIGR02293 family)